MQTQYRHISSGASPDPYPRAKTALSLPEISDNEPAANAIFEDIIAGLQYVFQTKNKWTFALHGTGMTGANAIFDNLIETGDKVLVLSTGFWGQIQANISERLGANVILYRKRIGTRFTLREIETALEKHRPAILAMVRGESDTTVKQPLEGVGDLCVKNDALLVVDDVAVVGIQPVLMDKLKIDAVYASSGVGIGAVPGLAPISLSPRAIKKLNRRSTPPKAYQTDLAIQAKLWNISGFDRYQTISMPLLYSLREALATIADEKIENTFKRHEEASKQLNDGLEALGLKHVVPNPADRMISTVAVYPPKGKSPEKIANYMFKNFNIEISTGFGPTKGQVIRIAVFAANANTQRVTNILVALRKALESPETNI